MAYNANIPQPTDRLKDSQADLLGNFQALVPFGDSYANLPVLPSDPSTDATHMALYVKQSTLTSTPAMWIRRESDGDTIEFTYTSGVSDGATILPSGLKMKWTVKAVSAGSNPFTWPVAASLPAFLGTPMNIQVTPIAASGSMTANLTGSPTATAFVVNASTAGSVYVFAIGV